MPNKNTNSEEVHPLERRIDELMAARDGQAPDAAKTQPATAPGLPDTDESAVSHMSTPQEAAPADKGDIAAVDSPKNSTNAAETPTLPSAVEDTSLDPLVDDIVSREGDELLAAKDAALGRAFTPNKPSIKDRIADAFSRWWDNKPARYGTLAGLMVIVVTLGVIPGSRYYLLNSAGVRATASVTILDSTNDLPLKNVVVGVPGQVARTNQDGVARFKGLKLGSQPLSIERLGFAKVERTVTLGLGSNPLGDVELRAVGTQFKFQLTDYLSGRPIKNAEISYGDDVSAQSDDKGEVILTIGKLSDRNLGLDITAGGYRSEKLTIEPTKTAVTKLTLVINRKQVFISKQRGKYDVYKVDIDGKNKQVLLAGTGIENERLALVTDPTGKKAALVSTRENKRNQDGYVLQTLTIIDIDDGDALTLDHSERIQLVGWVKDRLVYVRVKAGTSAGNPERQQLLSYNITTSAQTQLAGANSFTDVMIAKNSVYYAALNNYQGGQSQFAVVGADNTGKQVLTTDAVWNIARSSYDELNLTGNEKWFTYKLGDASAKKLATPPGNSTETRFYLDGLDGSNALWTDTRDGKGVLLLYDPATKSDKTLLTQSGLTYPLRWLDNRTVIYRIVTPQETADYVLSIDGGAARKIADVTNAAGLGTWFYY